MKDITPRTVTVKQGFEVVLEKEGFSRDRGNCTVTMFYGRRPNGTKIYAVPIIKNEITEMVGRAERTL